MDLLVLSSLGHRDYQLNTANTRRQDTPYYYFYLRYRPIHVYDAANPFGQKAQWFTILPFSNSNAQSGVYRRLFCRPMALAALPFRLPRLPTLRCESTHLLATPFYHFADPIALFWLRPPIIQSPDRLQVYHCTNFSAHAGYIAN